MSQGLFDRLDETVPPAAGETELPESPGGAVMVMDRPTTAEQVVLCTTGATSLRTVRSE